MSPSPARSAGIHGALVPNRVAESAGAGLGFGAATLLLAAVAAGVSVRPASALAPTGAATVLAALLVSYVLATTTGLPVLHPDPEPVERLALGTKLIEVVGLLAASSLIRQSSIATTINEAKGTSTI